MADIILKNANGEPIEYTGVSKIKVPTTDGGTAIFSEGTSGGGEQERSLKKYLDVKKSCYEFFANKYELTSDELNEIISYNDTQNVNNMSYMFSSCNNLTWIPLLNMENVDEMMSMFDGCWSLETLHLEKLIGVEYTFSNCYELKKIDIDSFEADWLDYEFASCWSLKAIIIRSFGVEPADIYGEDVFSGCYHFFGIVNSTYNPQGLKDGYIYIPRENIEAFQESSLFIDYNIQVRALEDYTVDGTTTGEFDDAKAGL